MARTKQVKRKRVYNEEGARDSESTQRVKKQRGDTPPTFLQQQLSKYIGCDVIVPLIRTGHRAVFENDLNTLKEIFGEEYAVREYSNGVGPFNEDTLKYNFYSRVIPYQGELPSAYNDTEEEAVQEPFRYKGGISPIIAAIFMHRSALLKKMLEADCKLNECEQEFDLDELSLAMMCATLTSPSNEKRSIRGSTAVLNVLLTHYKKKRYLATETARKLAPYVLSCLENRAKRAYNNLKNYFNVSWNNQNNSSSSTTTSSYSPTDKTNAPEALPLPDVGQESCEFWDFWDFE